MSKNCKTELDPYFAIIKLCPSSKISNNISCLEANMVIGNSLKVNLKYFISVGLSEN